MVGDVRVKEGTMPVAALAAVGYHIWRKGWQRAMRDSLRACACWCWNERAGTVIPMPTIG